jgi:hypothetical protein
MAIVPGDRDRGPRCVRDGTSISPITLPIDASTLRKGFGFGGIHTALMEGPVLETVHDNADGDMLLQNRIFLSDCINHSAG